jgi:predicted ATPase
VRSRTLRAGARLPARRAGAACEHTSTVSCARGLSRFVGREKEMATLESALRRATEGSGQVVGVVAEAGAGKSRLCYEFAERCRARGIEVRSAQSTSRGVRQPRLLLRDLLRSCFGISDLDTERAARDKIAGRMLLRGRSADRDLPLVLELLGIFRWRLARRKSQSTERERDLLETLTGLLFPSHNEGQRVIVVEELRWIDSPSEGFMRRLVARLAALRPC